jgi:hypothetical protein
MVTCGLQIADCGLEEKAFQPKPKTTTALTMGTAARAFAMDVIKKGGKFRQSAIRNGLIRSSFSYHA